MTLVNVTSTVWIGWFYGHLPLLAASSVLELVAQGWRTIPAHNAFPRPPLSASYDPVNSLIARVLGLGLMLYLGSMWYTLSWQAGNLPGSPPYMSMKDVGRAVKGEL